MCVDPIWVKQPTQKPICFSLVWSKETVIDVPVLCDWNEFRVQNSFWVTTAVCDCYKKAQHQFHEVTVILRTLRYSKTCFHTNLHYEYRQIPLDFDSNFLDEGKTGYWWYNSAIHHCRLLTPLLLIGGLLLNSIVSDKVHLEKAVRWKPSHNHISRKSQNRSIEFTAPLSYNLEMLFLPSCA